MKKVRVLIVDDSAFMRKAIRRMLSGAHDIEVVDTAADGREALAKVGELRPDIVTLDVKMAGMDGITALEHIMREYATPVIMLSSLTQEGADVTLKALELGAVDFIDKTRAESPMDITLLASELVAKVRAVAGVDIEKVRATLSEAVAAIPEQPRTPASPGDRFPGSTRVDVVALGTSTGGPPALHALIPKLPRNFPCGMIVVQHMPVGFTRTLAERLNTQSQLNVVEAAEGDEVRPGKVLIAPAGRHVKLRRSNGRYLIHLDGEPSDSPHKPSVDVMMASVAKACGRKSLGVLLTGMGNDGAKGMKAIKEAGGRTLAESEETCIIYGMPKSAVEEGAVDKVVPLHRMAAEILKEV
jgi:two-component system chemotaxis response regulator CheB